ncbi:MAG: 16S rRNA (uracil(1498)-N(3))-methyltransferase [Oscillospiraceae bacterium]|nr:16S rRNA (uracil(1498)-N(3))-methyltransferase [Oscillospiraceae bacterium]
MARFFTAGSNILGGIAYINAEDQEHIKVLRIGRGETVTVCDGQGTDYTCVIKPDGRGGVQAEVLDKAPSTGEPTIQCSVFAAFSKGERMDYTVQKAVELGAHSIYLFPCARCVAKYDGASLVKKVARWQRIAEEAAKQSGRGLIPEITALPSYAAALQLAAKSDLPIFMYELERSLSIKEAIASAPEAKTVSLVSGPEGGFEDSEAQMAADAGLVSVSLGPRILRCETAPAAALACVMYATDNM